MGTFSKEKRMMESKGYLPLFYLASVLPMLLAAIFMGPFLLSYVFIGGILVFFFSCLWGFPGLEIAALLFTLALLLGDSSLFKQVQPVLFFLIAIVSSFTVVILQTYIEEIDELACDEREEKILELTKALECLRSESLFVEQDLEALEKEVFLKEIEEDPNQTHLIHLLKQEQIYTQDLEQEICVLEMMITKMPFSPAQQRVRVKKIKQEKGEWFLPIEFQD